MAASQILACKQYLSHSFVESVGAVLFRLSTKQICILHRRERDEYVLAKGRRNCGEHRRQTAVREILEETGYHCRLLPLNFFTRAPPAVEVEQGEDKARFFEAICEPFALQVRELGGEGIKVVWWYVAAVEEGEAWRQDLQELERYDVGFYSYGDAVAKLSFEMDREMVKKAMEIVADTYGDKRMG
ncbi:MAG: hypothetical protein Q9219_006077 [cf. Caloplaca sp. 3 TL-2023]